MLFTNGYTCSGSLYCRITLTSLILIFIFQKTWIRLRSQRLNLKVFKINLMLELFMCLMLELLELLLNLYSFMIKAFGNCFVVYIFSWICTIFSIFFPTIIAKVGKFETKKTCWLWVGLVIQILKPKISQN